MDKRSTHVKKYVLMIDIGYFFKIKILCLIGFLSRGIKAVFCFALLRSVIDSFSTNSHILACISVLGASHMCLFRILIASLRCSLLWKDI